MKANAAHGHGHFENQNQQLTNIIPKFPPNHMCPGPSRRRRVALQRTRRRRRRPPPYSACPAAKKQCVTPHRALLFVDLNSKTVQMRGLQYTIGKVK
jgi:hypothetical protein